MKARDIMQRQPVTATPDMPIDDAVHLMITHHISGLPVIDPAGAVVGILSEGDLLRRMELGTDEKLPSWRTFLVSRGHAARDYVRSHARRVGELMTAPALSVTPQTDLADVVALMESRRIKRVPVVQDGRIVGVLTRSDLMRALESLLAKADTRPVADAELRRRLLVSLSEQSWGPRISFDVKVVNGVVELIGVITDSRTREATRVLAENTPGVRAVIDHLIWIEPMSGIPIDPLLSGDALRPGAPPP